MVFFRAGPASGQRLHLFMSPRIRLATGQSPHLLTLARSALRLGRGPTQYVLALTRVWVEALFNCVHSDWPRD